MDKAVILARGLGTRMRQAEQAELSDEQAAVAETGVKALIPAGGRPFLHYVLTALADAGYGRVCLVIGPEHQEVRRHFEQLSGGRLEIAFAVQAEPKGTADATAAAEAFADGDNVLVINSDNDYPVSALRALREDLAGSGLAAFTRDGLLRGNIPAGRIAKYAVIRLDPHGRLEDIIEKPTAADLASIVPPVRVSMNCWRFEPSIFEACRRIEPSARGEYELPDAVRYAMDHLGAVFEAVTVDGPVLDMSHRSDVAAVEAALAGREVRL